VVDLLAEKALAEVALAEKALAEVALVVFSDDEHTPANRKGLEVQYQKGRP
jgi:hypothetical protein